LGILLTLQIACVGTDVVIGQTRATVDETPLTLEPLVVTGTVTPVPLSQSTASVTVISREQIAAQQTASVTEVLRQVPGLHIDQPGARGSVSLVYLRGGGPSFTLVLIDGVKVNDPTNGRGGSFDFSTLNTDNIERIEIVRGPLSAVYGSDAISGVIHIVTRQPGQEAVRSADAAGGRFGYVRALVQARGPLGLADYALSGSYLDNGEPEGSGFRNTTVHASLGLSLSDALDLRGMVRYVDSDSTAFPEAIGGPEFAVLREVEKRRIHELLLGFTLVHAPLSWWEYQCQFGFYHRQEDISSPGVAPGGDETFGIPASATAAIFRRYELTLSHRLTVSRAVRLSLGAQIQFEEGENTGSLGLIGPTDFNLSRDTYAPFVEGQVFLLPGLLVQGGFRMDVVEGFDLDISPRVGLSYSIAGTQTTLWVNWGEGFKVPSFSSLADPTVGNPRLEPETSTSVDAGMSQTFWQKRVTVGVTYFWNDFTDLIDFDARTFRLVNRQAVTTEGVELSLQVQPWPPLRLTAQMTYVETDVRGSEATLRNRPRWRGGFMAQWHPVAGLQVTMTALFVGQNLDFAVPTGERM
jgi:outer membrane cobalamin receptor